MPRWSGHASRRATSITPPRCCAGRRPARSRRWIEPGSPCRSRRSRRPASGSATSRRPSGLSRACNEFAAGMERDFPGRFGFFATVPMPDIDATLEEIRYALRLAWRRRHRSDEQLRPGVAGRSQVRAGVRRAQPPQRDRLCAPDPAGSVPGHACPASARARWSICSTPRARSRACSTTARCCAGPTSASSFRTRAAPCRRWPSG